MRLGLSMRQPNGRTLIQRAIAILRARGSDAHLWLPGVGTINGLQTGNYLESTGNTLGTVDNPVGLVLDALGTVGAELVTNGGFDSDTGWTKEASWAIGSGVASKTAGVAGSIYQSAPAGLAQNTYCRVTFTATRTAGTCYFFLRDTDSTLAVNASGTYSVMVKAGANSAYGINIYAAADFAGSIDNISVREVSGTHLQQATTQNKPIVQRGAWNYLLNSVLAGGTSGVEGSGAVAPTGWVFPANTGQVTFSGTSVRFVASTQRPFIGETTGSIGVGNYIFSTKVEAIAVAAQISDLVSASNGTGTITINSYKRNNVAALASENVALGDTISVLVSVTVAGTIQPRFGPGISGTVTADITLSSPQLETGSTASDYSPTTTAAGSNPDSGRYAWRFDSTDLLSATITAGWESATVIDAAPTGAVASVQNVVGTHSIRGAMVTGVNLVTNGGGPFVNTTGFGVTGGGSSIAVVDGEIAVSNQTSSPTSVAYTATTVVGKTYLFVAGYRMGGSGGTLVRFNPFSGVNTANNATATEIIGSGSFTATSTSSPLNFLVYGTSATIGYISFISLYEINPVTHARILVKGTLTEAETDLYKSLANSFK